MAIASGGPPRARAPNRFRMSNSHAAILTGVASTTLPARPRGNRDRPRLHRFWNHAHEVYAQKPVLQARALHLDMVGELKLSFEVAPGNALVEHVPAFLRGLSQFRAADRPSVLLHLDREIAMGETGDCDEML